MAQYDKYGELIQEYAPTKLKTNRNMWKLMILTVLTLGLYSIFFFIPFSFDLDKAAPKPDRSKTWYYLFAHILALFTGNIVMIIWLYHITERVEEALAQRNIEYEFSTSHFWIWYVLGSFFLVGPFVYFHKLCRAMNLICEDYNEKVGAK
jgi:hypothetical protein